MDIIVTHCHLDIADFDSDRNEVPDSCRTIGITKIIVPAIQSRTWPKVLEVGFKLGFGGTLTYENTTKIHALAKALPMDAIVLDTDAHDMVVESHRGQRNSPAYIIESLNALVNIRNEDVNVIAQQTTLNTNDVIDFSAYD